MMIAIDDAHWVIFQQITPIKLDAKSFQSKKSLAGNRL
jgi:hypothetical protein